MGARSVVAVLAGALAAVFTVAGCDDAHSDGTADDDRAPTTTVAASAAPDDTPGPGAERVVPAGYTVVTIVYTDADGNEHEICVWLADTADERRHGLMGVTDLGGAAGMLFAYDEPSTSNFWMFGTPMPLSIAFFAGDGSFVSAADMEPCLARPRDGCPRYPAATEYTHALEVPQGDLDALGLGPGARVRVVAGSEQAACPDV